MRHHMQIVSEKGADLFRNTLNEAEVIDILAKRGFTMKGRENLACRREELQGAPKFDGLAGPMYGGVFDDGVPIIRYETWKAYAVYSS